MVNRVARRLGAGLDGRHQVAARNFGRMARAATTAELPFLETEEERKWSHRARFLFILTAASACWAIPATIAYLVFAH